MTNVFRGKWLIWGMALAAAMAAAFGVFNVLANNSQTTPVMVFSKSVAKNTVVTNDLVKIVDMPTAMVPGDLLTSDAMAAGRVTTAAVTVNQPVTFAVVGAPSPLPPSIPDGYVLASLEVPPADAVGGQIKAGDLVDVAAVNGEANSGTALAKVVLRHVLVVDVATTPSNIQDTSTTNSAGQLQAGPNSYAAKSGIPQIYTVAVSSVDFAKLAVLRNSSLYLALTNPNSQQDTSVNAAANLVDLFASGAVGASFTGVSTPASAPSDDTATAPATTPPASAPTGPSAGQAPASLPASPTPASSR